MNIIYTSENKIYSCENSNKSEIPCGRVIKYKETLDSIRRRSEWKTTGSGAMFTGTAMKAETIEMPARITGLACCGDKDGGLIYGIQLDGSSSLYRRSTDRTDMNEGLILSGNDISFGAFDFLDGKLAVSIGSSMHLHIGVMEPPSSAYEEFTDGDTIEEDPYWSRFNKGRIYFSTAGYGRDANGVIGGISPRSGAYLDIVTREMEEFLSDPKYDYYKIKDDKYGNIYYIRQPYGGEKSRDGIKFTDVLFFPVRLLKGLFGWLNFMCTIWGGEPLKSGGSGLPNNEKTKERSAKDIIIDGNVIKAKEIAKAEDAKDGELSGFMPLSRVLVKREADGTETVLKKGVLDYSLCDEGILISNGRQITLLADGNETLVTKAYLARNLQAGMSENK